LPAPTAQAHSAHRLTDRTARAGDVSLDKPVIKPDGAGPAEIARCNDIDASLLQSGSQSAAEPACLSPIDQTTLQIRDMFRVTMHRIEISPKDFPAERNMTIIDQFSWRHAVARQLP
jgi:hypothetical protein